MKAKQSAEETEEAMLSNPAKLHPNEVCHSNADLKIKIKIYYNQVPNC
jgi:hypothetical protein